MTEEFDWRKWKKTKLEEEEKTELIKSLKTIDWTKKAKTLYEMPTEELIKTILKEREERIKEIEEISELEITAKEISNRKETTVKIIDINIPEIGLSGRGKRRRCEISLPKKMEKEKRLISLWHEAAHAKYTGDLTKNMTELKKKGEYVPCRDDALREIVNAIEDIRIEKNLIKEKPRCKQKLEERAKEILERITKERKEIIESYPTALLHVKLREKELKTNYGLKTTEKVKRAIEIIEKNKTIEKNFYNVVKDSAKILKLFYEYEPKTEEEKEEERRERDTSCFEKEKIKGELLTNDSSLFGNTENNEEETEKEKKERETREIKIENAARETEKREKERSITSKTIRFGTIRKKGEAEKEARKLAQFLRTNLIENKLTKNKENEGKINIKRIIKEIQKGNQKYLGKRIFKNNEENKTKKHVFSILIDYSGSMEIGTETYEKGEEGKKISHAKQTGHTIAKALEKTGINYEIGGYYAGVVSIYPEKGEKGEQREIEITVPIKEYEKEYKEKRLEQSTNGMVLCDNNDGWTIRKATKRILEQKQPKKTIIIISDGQPSNSETSLPARENLLNAVEEARKKGIKVIGLGIDGADQKTLTFCYGKTGKIIKTQNLTKELGKTIKEELGL